MSVAMMLRTTSLVTGATMIAATVGANGVYFTAVPVAKAVTATGWVAPQAAGSTIMTIDQPVSAVMAAIVAAVLGKWLTGKTPLDLVLVPFAVALIGTTVGFVVFTAMSFKQNNLGGNIAQTLVTPKVQFPNLLKSPILAVGPLVIAMVMAPIAVVGFYFRAPFLIAGLGLNSFIAPLWMWANNKTGFFVLMAFGVVIPAVLAWCYYRFLKMAGKTKPNDLYLEEI